VTGGGFFSLLKLSSKSTNLSKLPKIVKRDFVVFKKPDAFIVLPYKIEVYEM
jgi:hypothetical protein